MMQEKKSEGAFSVKKCCFLIVWSVKIFVANENQIKRRLKLPFLRAEKATPGRKESFLPKKDAPAKGVPGRRAG